MLKIGWGLLSISWRSHSGTCDTSRSASSWEIHASSRYHWKCWEISYLSTGRKVTVLRFFDSITTSHLFSQRPYVRKGCLCAVHIVPRVSKGSLQPYCNLPATTLSTLIYALLGLEPSGTAIFWALESNASLVVTSG